MSLAFLVAFLSVTISASTPTIQNLVNVEVIEYLQKYGYLNEVDVTTHTSIEDEQIKQAIALFQEYYQIPDNGALNDNTLHQMRQPRCGLPDMSHQEQNSVVAKWRKTHLTWNFHLADADTLKTTAHAFRYIDGSLYFLHKRQYYKFNEFTRTVTNADKFDMNILNVNCPTDGLLKQLQDLLTRLLQSSNSLTSTALNTEDD
ncbi:Matrix metalloproteinase-19 [Cyphomyrmex costatus]|uniref:Matrix metalloproteinase-19 n=1 Tax=Cyphomyrmex costatus TaxID=456900 RepID=A0A151I6T0_9HYME|nr:Matrix metalloproteinase-19 [Cyphomyrmex costatus]